MENTIITNQTEKNKKHSKKKILKRVIIAVAILLVLVFTGIGIVYWTTVGYPAKLKKAEKRIEHFQSVGFEKEQILLCGSSFIQYWTSSENDLAPLTTYNVGVEATVVSDWKKWIDLLILPFNPRAILLYVGSNDMHGSIGSKKGTVVADEVKELLTSIHEKLPQTIIYYVSIAPTIAREKVWDESSACNSEVSAYSKTREYLRFIDCTQALLNSDGSLKKEIYAKDNLHFNDAGYAIWKSVIAPILLDELA
ncbi:MAG: GDSL-type esterase/lipase family protein [Christensenellaceae bacterium]|jgi:lysophospholipase L1-like esterase|nr:GDSL-type esterase/lipase family protein [Christensenellaceae bacterium]